MFLIQQALHDAALSAIARGWQVFPVRPSRKEPAVRDWEARASDDPQRIARCWNHDAYNVGIATGPSGLVVIDLDVPKPGQRPPARWAGKFSPCGSDVIHDLASQQGAAWPVETFTVRTGSGGRHYYFTAPDGAALRSTVGKLGWLIDTRAAGGYVIAAGSSVRGGKQYRVLSDAPVAPLPTWLAALLTPTDPQPARRPHLARVLSTDNRRCRYVEAAFRRELEKVLSQSEGGRNRALNEAAFSLGQLVALGLLDEPTVIDALTSAGCETGLKAAEVALTIRSGLTAGQRTPRARQIPA